MKNTEIFLNQLIKENDTCILALSGGSDSMCLFHLLLNLKKNKPFSLICVHVNHNVRENAKEEQQALKKYVENYQIPCECFSIDNYQKERFTEAEGREKRYFFLKKVYDKYHANYLFTAHHADDLVETILMRIIRGSSLKGYSGFQKITHWNEYTIVRPLIEQTKEEILKYVESQNITFFQDETNDQENYLRNRIRKKWLPLLQKEEPRYATKFLKFSETLAKSDTLLKEQIQNQNIFENHKIKTDKFLLMSPFEQEVAFRMYLSEIYQNEIKFITDKHLKIAITFINNSKEKGKLDFPKKRTLYKNKKYIWLQNKEEMKEFMVKLENTTILPNEDIVRKEEKYEEKSNFEIHLNSKEITLPLYITTRKPGMKMEVKNLNGTKKVNDILINEHIPNELKDQIPILIDAKETVLWILGIKKSKYDLEKNENYDIIYKYIKKGRK